MRLPDRIVDLFTGLNSAADDIEAKTARNRAKLTPKALLNTASPLEVNRAISFQRSPRSP
jgi:hypothetical protein